MPDMNLSQDNIWNSVNLRDRFKAETPDMVEISMDGGVTRYKVEDTIFEEDVSPVKNKKKRKWVEKDD